MRPSEATRMATWMQAMASMIEGDIRSRAEPSKGGQQCGPGGALGPMPPSAVNYLQRLARDLRDATWAPCERGCGLRADLAISPVCHSCLCYDRGLP